MNPEHTPTASSPSTFDRATRERSLGARESHLHHTVVRALATRPPLTGILVLDYGLRYVAAALGASASWAYGTGTKWALYLAAAGLVSFCAVVGLRRGVDRMDVDGPGAGVEAALDLGELAEGT